MKIEKFVTGIISTNCYIVTNEETKETVIVDPANLSKAMIGYIDPAASSPHSTAASARTRH